MGAQASKRDVHGSPCRTVARPFGKVLPRPSSGGGEDLKSHPEPSSCCCSRAAAAAMNRSPLRKGNASSNSLCEGDGPWNENQQVAKPTLLPLSEVQRRLNAPQGGGEKEKVRIESYTWADDEFT